MVLGQESAGEAECFVSWPHIHDPKEVLAKFDVFRKRVVAKFQSGEGTIKV